MQQFDKKITKETVIGRFLLFFPKTAEEAQAIIDGCEKVGGRTKNGSPLNLAECVRQGMGFIDGHYFAEPNLSYDRAPGGNWRATVENFDENYMSQERRFLLDQFKALADRLTAIETRLTHIEKQVMPAHLEKGTVLPFKQKGAKQ